MRIRSNAFRIFALLGATGLAVVFLVIGFAPQGGRVAQAQEPPNIVFIYSDDQDVGTMQFMPNVEEELAANGVTFENAFATTPLCCPTRTTFLRGQYSHNTHVTSNKYPLGGYQKFLDLAYDNDHLGLWLQGGGYATGHIGKLMNGWGATGAKPPPGFDSFVGPKQASHSDDVRQKAVDFVKDRAPAAQPFYLSVSPNEPHEPFWFPPRHADLYGDLTRPRTPDFNEEDVSDKPAWIREVPQLTPEQVAEYDEIYRKRLRGVRAVDDLVGRLVDVLRNKGELDNTYFMYSSDNGYMLGAHRLPSKMDPYEESIRVPLVVSGPGVEQGVVRTEITATNDVAPTIMHLAGLERKSFFDGRSLRPLLDGDPETGKGWRTAVGIEWLGPENSPRRYYGVRTASGEKYVYHTATGEEEYYDLKDDPYELENVASDPANAEKVSELKAWAQELLECQAEGCRAAER